MAMTRDELEAEIRDYNQRRYVGPNERTIEVTGHEAIAILAAVQKRGPLAAAAFILERLQDRYEDMQEMSEDACMWDGDDQYPFDGGLFSIGLGAAKAWFILANVNEDQTYRDDGYWNGWTSGQRVIVFRSEDAARLAFAGLMSLNTAWRLSNGYIGDGMFEDDGRGASGAAA